MNIIVLVQALELIRYPGLNIRALDVINDFIRMVFAVVLEME